MAHGNRADMLLQMCPPPKRSLVKKKVLHTCERAALNESPAVLYGGKPLNTQRHCLRRTPPMLVLRLHKLYGKKLGGVNKCSVETAIK